MFRMPPQSSREIARPFRQVLELSGHALAPREGFHRPDVQILLLSEVDGERIFEVLIAAPAELHHDRVLRCRHRKPATAPDDSSLGPERLPMCGCGLAHEAETGSRP